MAETMFGAHSSDPNSEWAQFDFGQQQLRAYPAPDLDFQTSHQIPNYQQPAYADYPVNNHAVQYDGHGQAIFQQQPSGTDADNAQPRLTQDQIAALENTFVEAPKPKMEHKKNLAERLGLELPRVNHWFQNRRQKAKSQRYHSKQKSDVSSSDGPSGAIAQTLSLPTSETPISSTAIYSQQAPFPATEFSPDFHLDGTHSFPQPFDMHPTAAMNFGSTHDSHGYHAQPVGLDEGLIAGPVWMNELQHMPTGESYGSSSVDHAITSISPESLTGSHVLLASANDSKPDHVNQPFPQNQVMGSGFLDNLSSQTLDSNASSICDTNNLMTPPTNTPPLPWLTSEFDGRRTSDSSELAHNVEGMHIQQNQSGLGLFDAKVNSSTESRMTSATGIATPEASPEQVISKSVPPSDIASRRKRQKPAALRPDSGRSASFAGPVLGSPHSRTPSTSLAHPNQVRRIQSQGQTLNHQYRVQKNAATPAQISPRNLQAYFDKQITPHTYKHSTPESANSSPTTIQTLPNRPSASAASANRSPAEYQHEFHVVRPNNRWDSANSYQIPHHANSSVPDLHVATSLPSNPLVHGSATGLPCQQYSHPVSYHCPPQSAPPHQTTFFDNSPVNQNGPFQPPGSHPPYFPAVSHGLDLGSTAMHQPTPFAPQHSHSYLSSHLPPFAPVYQFPQESPATSNLSQTLFTGLYPSQISEPVIPPPELDIRVDVGPEPKLTSRFDKFEFNHTFADKYAQQGEKK